MSIRVVIPESKAKIQRQIEALEHIIEFLDVSEKDKEIHTKALEALKEALRALEAVENEPSPAGRKKKDETTKVHELRENGLTQEQIARELNISLSTVRRELKNKITN